MSRYVLITSDPGFERRVQAGGFRTARHLPRDRGRPPPAGSRRPAQGAQRRPGRSHPAGARFAAGRLHPPRQPLRPPISGDQRRPGYRKRRGGRPARDAGRHQGLAPARFGCGRHPFVAGTGKSRSRRTSTGLGSSVEGLPRSGRIIAVMSPKGGVGKTTITTNLAVGLGKEAPMGVVVVDLDLQFGDVASGLMLEPERTLADAVVGAAVQDSVVLKSYLTLHPSGIYASVPRSAPLTPIRYRANRWAPPEPALQRIPVRRGGHGAGSRRARSGHAGTGHRRSVGLRHGHSQHPRASNRIRRPRRTRPCAREPPRRAQFGRSADRADAAGH